MKRLMTGIALAVSLSVLAGKEEMKWSAGTKEAPGNKEITVQAKVKPCGEGISKFTVTFKNDASGSGYVQFPLRASEDFPAFEFEAQADMDAVAEIWLSDGKTWQLQDKIKFREGRRQLFTLAVKNIDSDKCKYLRLLFPRQDNPATVEVLLMQPDFVR